MKQEQRATLGDLIRQGRKNKEWSQEDLAEYIGVTPMSIRRWESNKAFPRPYTLNKLKTLFGIRDEMIVALPQVIREDPKIEEPKVEETDIEDYEVEIVILPRKVYRGLIVNKRARIVGPGDIRWHIERHVTVDGEQLPFYTKLRPGDTPDEHYGWGYNGQGPRSLAVSILQDYFMSALRVSEKHLAPDLAWKYSSAFKEDFVWWFRQTEEWEIWSGAITAWLQEQKDRLDERPERGTLDDGDWCGWSERWDKYKGT
jgi:transcriptional regulator with XRE-family HTH domain